MIGRTLPLFVAALLFVPAAVTGDIAITAAGGAYQVIGWRATTEPAQGWGSMFWIYAGSGDVPALLGSYSVEAGVLTFHPRWPLSPGVHVRAEFHLPGQTPVQAAFDIPKAAAGSVTRIEHVYPTSDVLPSNALKLYIYFSGSMRSGEAWQHIRLLDSQGREVKLPFLEIDQELWDPSHTRLTVLFDPGRIKRGLLPLRESGPNIEEGKSYTLVIAREWKDANGAELAAGFTKPFRVGAAERESIDPAKWRISTPRPATTDPLMIDFARPLDYALLQHALSVAGVKGAVEVTQGETEWRFTPEARWKAGAYQLTVNTTLEDLAGNRVGRAFDVDTFREVTSTIEKESVSISFRIGHQ